MNINTSERGGTRILTQSKLSRELRNLAYRRHILELQIEKAYLFLMDHQWDLKPCCLRDLKECWKDTDLTDFAPLEGMLEDADITNLVSFATILLQEGRPREDYKELLELWVIALGKSPLRGIKFKSPGAMHRVRWMAKLIYAIKLFLFRHQLTDSKRQNYILFLPRTDRFRPDLYLIKRQQLYIVPNMFIPFRVLYRVL